METQMIDQSEGVFLARQLPEFSNSLRPAETAFYRKFLTNCNIFYDFKDIFNS